MKTIEQVKAALPDLNLAEVRLLRDLLNEILDGVAAAQHFATEEPKQHAAFHLQIEFCESTAGSFSKALKLAKTADSYFEREENSKTWYVACWNKADLTATLPLIDALSRMRNKRCLLKGQEVDWEDTFGFANCAEDRNRAYRPELYCFGESIDRLNPWGCIHSRMMWSRWERWFTFGYFERKGIMGWTKNYWHFDKDRIRHEIKTNLYGVRHCPYLNTQFVDAIIESLPDTIDVSNDDDWGYHECYEERPGCIKIVDSENGDDYSFDREYFADGVKPNGVNALKDVITRAANACGMKDVAVRHLVEQQT